MNDGYGVTLLKFFGNGEPNLCGGGAVVGANEGRGQVRGSKGSVNVEDSDAFGCSALESGNEGTGVSWRNNQSVNTEGGELIDLLNLVGEIGGVVDAADREIVVLSVCGVVNPGV